MTNVEIRRPKLNDLKELNEFFRLVITDTFIKEGLEDLKEDIENEINQKNKYINSDLESNGVDRYFLIAFYNNTIIGTIEYGKVSKFIADCTNKELSELVEIGTVFVHPNYQNKGLGSLLLNAMYLTLQSKNIKEFCLDSGYTRAQKIWKKKFKDPDYLLKDYWGEGYDHMIWRIKISNLSISFNI